MINKKITAIITTLMLIISALAVPVFAQADGQPTVIGKLAVIERSVYGSTQTGALADRINKVEEDIYGAKVQDALLPRVDKLYSHVLETSDQSPSMRTKLNAVEWNLTHRVSDSPIKARIESLETTMNGSPETGSMDSRLTKLLKLSYTGGQFEVAATTIPKDTLIKIKTLSTLNSKTSKVGDSVALGIAEDVVIDGVLLLPQGAVGNGKVTKVEAAKNFGRDAKLEISFDHVTAMDGSKVETLLGDKAKKETKSLATAAGASVAGMIVLGPVGIIGGAFVNGKEANIPIGSQLYIQTKEDVTVYGIRVK
ncbi:hypothetical protein [Sporomusa acidovorans]|uniref:Uncharacterized protein n=1 Tax=Sporomusa acidovorans (strain ATCC 49682 / DSM 3132 / Mol) TaxID=1123286 RepID=A0ABZ3J7T2_SPOA4|nr:hypothetical protein [Sporomusa acidovorans]OZC19317.1 hypothetical protein SPACI_29070 [Sporomusa acidovorans DSM 3132]SDD80967.1 hypothetical protein SAMN04488499_1004111 [Sporomusa acidovorans]